MDDDAKKPNGMEEVTDGVFKSEPADRNMKDAGPRRVPEACSPEDERIMQDVQKALKLQPGAIKAADLARLILESRKSRLYPKYSWDVPIGIWVWRDDSDA